MVGRWGMSDALGPVSLLPRDGSSPLLPGASEVSEETQRLVDEEVRRLVDRCENEVRSLLSSNRDRLDALVEALLERETIDGPEAVEILEEAGLARPAELIPTGVEGADALLALTEGDNRNVMAAELAIENLGIRKAMAKVNDPVRAAAYAELGIATICRTTMLVDAIQGFLGMSSSGLPSIIPAVAPHHGTPDAAGTTGAGLGTGMGSAAVPGSTTTATAEAAASAREA
jgi:hypothetical protein